MKPFVCKVCKMEFARKGNLKTHERIHTGEMPYKCKFPDCPKTYKTWGHLNEHYNSYSHLGKKNFNCATCGKYFFRAHQLKNHQPCRNSFEWEYGKKLNFNKEGLKSKIFYTMKFENSNPSNNFNFLNKKIGNNNNKNPTSLDMDFNSNIGFNFMNRGSNNDLNFINTSFLSLDSKKTYFSENESANDKKLNYLNIFDDYYDKNEIDCLEEPISEFSLSNPKTKEDKNLSKEEDSKDNSSLPLNSDFVKNI